MCIKFARWFSEIEVPVLASRACRVLDLVRDHVPPCVLFCLIATWCNAWCTSRRFQNRGGECHLCSERDGEDSLEHYAVCPFQWEVFATKLRRPVYPRSLSRFLVLDAETIEDMVLHACHAYAVKRGVDTRRSSSLIWSADAVKGLLWQGHRTAMIHHNGLARRYLRIFAPKKRQRPESCPDCMLDMFECNCVEVV